MLQRIPLIYYAASGLFNFLALSALAIFAFLNNPRSPVNRIFSLFTLTAAGWGLFHFFWLRTTNDPFLADFLLRTVMLFVVIMPATFTHFILNFLGIDDKKRINIGNYVITFIIAATVYTPLYAKDMGAFLVFPFWLKPGPFFHLHLLHFVGNVIYSHFLMFRVIKHRSGILRNQVFYVFIGTAIGYTAGIFNYFPWYRIPIPPFLNPLVSVYVAFVAIAIIKYRLLDIKIVLTRAGVFSVVYFPVVFIPFWIAPKFIHTNLWWVPVLLMGILATLGVFIYSELRKRAEAALLREDLKKYNTLEKFSRSLGITKELELDRLAKLIIYRLVKTMNISYGAIYLFDEDEDKFILKADRSFKGVEPSVHALDADNDLIKFIKFRGKGFMYEDLQKLISQKVNNKINDKANDKENRKKQCDADLSKALTQMEQLKAKVVIPHFIKDELIGFLVLGEKVSLMPYSDADTSKLTTLSSSAGLAITNAISMLKLRDRERDLAAKGRVIDIGNLASATEHQVGNILNTIIWGVFGVKSDKAITELLQQKPEALAAFKKKLDEITTNAQSGRNIIKEIRDYSQQDKSKEHVLVNLKEVTGKAKSMFYMDINKLPQIDISILGADDVPAVLGSPVGLQQVFINLFNNGYDSTQEMKQHIQEHPELGISDYKGRIEVTMRRVKGKVEIHVIDNGKGITEEVAKKLFGPLFTTKGSLEKREEMNLNGGTGIGLYIMRRIILDHEGTIALFRTEPLKGADFIIELPVP